MLQCLQLADVITSEQYQLYEVRFHASQHWWHLLKCTLSFNYRLRDWLHVIDFTCGEPKAKWTCICFKHQNSNRFLYQNNRMPFSILGFTVHPRDLNSAFSLDSFLFNCKWVLIMFLFINVQHPYSYLSAKLRIFFSRRCSGKTSYRRCYRYSGKHR